MIQGFFTGRNLDLDFPVIPCDTGSEEKVKPTPQLLTEFPGLSGTFSTILKNLAVGGSI